MIVLAYVLGAIFTLLALLCLWMEVTDNGKLYMKAQLNVIENVNNENDYDYAYLKKRFWGSSGLCALYLVDREYRRLKGLKQ